MSEKLLIFQKSYDLALWLYPTINRIPKSHRLVLGRHLEELLLRFLTSIIKANKTRDKERLEIQKHLSDTLDCLRILIRLSKDLRFISISQYTQTIIRLNEIGKMLYGWIASTKS